MKQRLTCLVSTILLCASLLACSTLPAITSIDTPEEIYTWERKLTHAQGQLELDFTLPQSSRAVIAFNKGETTNFRNATVRFELDNRDCQIGHQASITYQNTDKDWLIKYAKHEVPWDSNNRLTISWDKEQMTFSINNEEFVATLSSTVDRIKIYAQPITIQTLEYSPK